MNADRLTLMITMTLLLRNKLDDLFSGSAAPLFSFDIIKWYTHDRLESNIQKEFQRLNYLTTMFYYMLPWFKVISWGHFCVV